MLGQARVVLSEEVRDDSLVRWVMKNASGLKQSGERARVSLISVVTVLFSLPELRSG